MTLSVVVRNFLLATSMKGVPRAVRSHHSGLKLLWVGAVLFFLFVSLSQTTFLLMEYFAYPKTTTTSEKPVHGLDQWDGMPAPHVTVCNLNPLATNPEVPVYLEWPSLDEYYHKVDQILQCSGCSDELLTEYNLARMELLSIEGYYQYMGPKTASMLGHQLEDFILSCHVLVLHGPTLGKVPCSKAANISRLASPRYFNCYSVKPDANTSIAVGISLVLYLDNFRQQHYPFFNLLSDSGQSAGVNIMVYEPGTLPIMAANGLKMMPGTHTVVQLKGERRDRMPAPYGDCLSRPYLCKTLLSGSLEYSTEACFVACVESLVIKNCGCRDVTFPGVLDLISSNLLNSSSPYCQDLGHGVAQLLQKLKCARAMRASLSTVCLRRCKMPCQEILYHTTVSASEWPSELHYKSFYNTIIQGKPFADKFNILHLSKSRYSDPRAQEWQKTLMTKHLISSNFLKADIYLSDHRYLHLIDTEKVTASTVLSQLGGALNLWSGITAVIVVEVLELIYHVVQAVTKQGTPEEDKSTVVEHVSEASLPSKASLNSVGVDRKN